ncbi:unnamed protein product, partial [marine sediment metagenome]
MLVPDTQYAGEVSRAKRSASSGEGPVQFQHLDLKTKNRC